MREERHNRGGIRQIPVVLNNFLDEEDTEVRTVLPKRSCAELIHAGAHHQFTERRLIPRFLDSALKVRELIPDESGCEHIAIS